MPVGTSFSFILATLTLRELTSLKEKFHIGTNGKTILSVNFTVVMRPMV